ncbi:MULTISPECIES: phosphopantothenoylcysteine decarboxylase domain-containing protein [Rhodopirellula]|uniref:Phosphopantothenoylcysteine decarboxylase/phosphopantothenate/cysteine ligase n=1 Tax=Rhodopirellula europaea SH398 TaxID=1263868 RepID=M5S6X0_9BACT|nr:MULTISPECIES: phosphopantothenoylcysteine decarboxylase [Rhodopirellula]EMI27383.1 phosphopantothenoylcysteine decarboxylase/phosphopantothenate/cysteine ligase [Rhodopirellula europaea SH398]MCR9209536.1 phosphopantothenoylcysteine decarboxylase [bacterium]
MTDASTSPRRRILITSGPTRQYLDPVRYLTNASSGRMGAALAGAALALGHDVVMISGPVSVDYPDGVELINVLTTQEMLQAAGEAFQDCDGAIGAAAPCDYMPRHVSTQKLSKTGEPLQLELIETPDVIATLGQSKRQDQWVVGFALETDDRRFRATVKLERKHCDLMVSNGPEAINSSENQVELLDPSGDVIEHIRGTKEHVAQRLLHQIHHRLLTS